MEYRPHFTHWLPMDNAQSVDPQYWQYHKIEVCDVITGVRTVLVTQDIQPATSIAMKTWRPAR